MRRPVCYDITRLLTRIVNPTPNGIDRVDYAFAHHFLSMTDPEVLASAFVGFGMRLARRASAIAAVEAIGAHWGELETSPDNDPAFRRVVAWLAGETSDTVAVRRLRRCKSMTAVGGWLARDGLSFLARTPRTNLPYGSAYLNVSQFPLWLASPFEWLETRRDLRAVFFVHDLLPLTLPEYFRRAEYDRHLRRLQNVARFAAAAIVTTTTVEAELRTHLASLGRRDMPIFVAPTPVSSTFATSRVVDRSLGDHPFFVLCSTLEPRKNHLMILAVWRELAARMGRGTPKLVLAGARGWHFDPIVDLLARSPTLREHVIEVGGLSTPGLKRLIDNAEALLMPSFGEGYGLPVQEALAAGAPVIAADIPVFREIKADGLTLVSPLAGEAWLAAIDARVQNRRGADTAGRRAGLAWPDYFASLESFIATL